MANRIFKQDVFPRGQALLEDAFKLNTIKLRKSVYCEVLVF